MKRQQINEFRKRVTAAMLKTLQEASLVAPNIFIEKNQKKCSTSDRSELAIAKQ